MKKYRLFGFISAVFIALSIIYSFVGVAQIPKSQVLLSTNPPLLQILPFEAGTQKQQSPVNFTFQAVDAAGKSLENSLINLEILTPPRNPWLTTDFPIVEGTKLLEIEAAAPDGKLEIQQILPIRGNYQLKVNVSPLVKNAFAPYQASLNLNVRENPIKYKYLAVVAAILFSVGLLGGWVIGGQEELREGEIAPQSVRLLLSALTTVAIVTLLFINITAEVAEAHGSEHEHKTENIAPSVQKNQGLEVKVLGDKNATVGKVANLAVEVQDSNTGEAIKDVVLNVKTIALENDLTVFTYQGFPNQEGKLIWQEQFFDGAPHKVEIEATPVKDSPRQFLPVKVGKLVEVEGIAPPISTRLISLFYFTAIVGIGMTIGLLIQQRRQPPVRGN
ncbi:hypothetical protein H6G06_20480 [Anabaena sphaerica FACHB-251]|uniref:Uncharacterized protein n=1 Tax=Anabaena sphaerica FACHB-251 TaxID=2692883 RepID=A0A926WJL5_9NOST|nr:hypothetical protein [Anabaena sphaerica]MBD2295786.1 hypothetical protein [Anabaena sphaerica FACHB-251]